MYTSSEAVLIALAGAEDAVSRLDERVAACPYAAGWAARLDFSEATAWGWNAGQVVGAEELLLHDESMDLQIPHESLKAAHGVIRARRKATAGGAELLSPEGAAWLLARRDRPPSPARAGAAPARCALEAKEPLLPQLLGALARAQRGVTEDADRATAEWLELLGLEHPRLTPLLHAATALAGWEVVRPYPRETYLGPVLTALWLRRRGRVRTHLLGLEAGVRAVRRNRPEQGAEGLEARLLFWLEAIGASAAVAGEALNRLELARQVAVRRIGARRAHCRHQDLLELLLERPLVTAPLVAARLKLSGQSARRLLAELGGAVTEVTGQARYRAWRL